MADGRLGNDVEPDELRREIRMFAGEAAYERLEDEVDRLMSAGLAGPVRLMVLEATD